MGNNSGIAEGGRVGVAVNVNVNVGAGSVEVALGGGEVEIGAGGLPQPVNNKPTMVKRTNNVFI
jgi:hypothetical protein